MRDMVELTLLKIGGSVITEKSKGVFGRVRYQEMERVAREIAEGKRREIVEEEHKLILVHGVGSFGHPCVEKYGLKERSDPEGVIRTHLACKKLNLLFCDQLLRHEVLPYPIHPFSSFKIDEELEFNLEIFTDAIFEGFIPVSHGDMVYNRKKKFFEVLSGDAIISELAKRLRDRSLRIGLATDIDGVFFEGKVLKEIRDIELLRALKNSGGDERSDVTGGMIGKLRSLAAVAEFAEVVIFNGMKDGNITKFLKGENLGTKIRLGDV